ncbi:Zinc finger, RING-type [Dillenia turbinata]|uniref:Zinc finger, RING-type n=1 Tax=Dillenia turbinata TaxID=194707 RepID=A0AAN8UC12_9MAGN
MAVPSLAQLCEAVRDNNLVMERPDSISNSERVIDIMRGSDSIPSSSSPGRPTNGRDQVQNEDRPSSSLQPTVSQRQLSTSIGTNSRNSSFIRRGGDGYGRRRRSPLNSGIWILIELCLTLSQIIASVVVLAVSRDERPRTPLFAWIIGYTSGCAASLPLLYWRYRHRNQASEQDSSQARSTTNGNVSSGSAFYSSLSIGRTEGEDPNNNVTTTGSRQSQGRLHERLNVLVEYFKMALDCFLAVWFVLGNVWIFGGHGSSADAPNLYRYFSVSLLLLNHPFPIWVRNLTGSGSHFSRLCVVFLTISCIGYATPFILCATVCCCLPCIISILGSRENFTNTRGATAETISALPTYKFKVKKNRNAENRESNSSECGGVAAEGTEKERTISGEDAVCCICLGKYVNNDDLRELPCSHFFHKDCIDKWLKINAMCPLCKSEVGDNPSLSLNEINISGQ